MHKIKNNLDMVVILHRKKDNVPVLVSESNIIYAIPIGNNEKGSKIKLIGTQSSFDVNESVERIMSMINDLKK